MENRELMGTRAMNDMYDTSGIPGRHVSGTVQCFRKQEEGWGGERASDMIIGTS